MALYRYDMGSGVEAFSTERGAVLPFPVIQAHQVHGDKVARVYMEGSEMKASLIMPGGEDGAELLTGPCWGTMRTDKERGIPEVLKGVDALITDVPGLAIAARTADCIPVLLYDPVHHAVAAVHAGWRGTVARISSKALAAMSECYGTQPGDILAVIGPGIGPESFQVGREVADAFEAAAFDMAEILIDEGPVCASTSGIASSSGQPLRSMRGGLHIDLWRANELTLINDGVPSSRIAVSGIDTYLAADQFYSARRETIACPRIINAIMLLA